jgi:hypothetical protein
VSALCADFEPEARLDKFGHASLAPLVRSRVNNGEDCGLERSGKPIPGSDCLRQIVIERDLLL